MVGSIKQVNNVVDRINFEDAKLRKIQMTYRKKVQVTDVFK